MVTDGPIESGPIMIADGPVDSRKKEDAISSGLNGGIHLLTVRETGLYPGANLVKETRTDDFFDAERAFLELKIAGILFPGRVIDVVGFEGLEPKNQYPFRYLQGLYSKRADIPDAHLKFSTDMTLMDKGLAKVSTHDCAQCIEHRGFHEQNDLERKSREARSIIYRAGISPDGGSDPSDYCLTPNGIIFFELRDFDPGKVSAYLDSQTGTVADPQAVLKMLERYKEIPTVEQVTGKPRR